MIVSRRHKVLVIALALVVTIVGFLSTSVPASGNPRMNANVSLTQSSDQVLGGSSNEYEVSVANIGEATLSDLKLHVAMGDDFYGLELLNPTQPCALYTRVSADEAPQFTESFNCFRNEPKIISPRIWETYKTAGLEGQLVDLQPNQEVRMKIRARAPYSGSRVTHRVYLYAPYHFQGTSSLDIGQSIIPQSLGSGRIRESFEGVTASEQIIPGSTNDPIDGLPKAVLRVTYVHEEGDPVYAFKPVPYIDTVYSYSSRDFRFATVYQKKFAYLLKCNPALSSPGICDRAIFKTEPYDQDRYENPYSQRFDEFRAGEKIVLDLEVAPRLKCMDNADKPHFVRPRNRIPEAFNRPTFISGKPVMFGQIVTRPCEPTPVTIEVSDLNNGQPLQAGTPGSFTISVKNNGDVDVADISLGSMRMILARDYSPSQTYHDQFVTQNGERIRVHQRVTCEIGDGLYCPENLKTVDVTDVATKQRSYMWSPERIKLIPAGKEVRLKVEHTFEFPHCLKGQGYTTGQEITNLKFYTKLTASASDSSNSGPIAFTPREIVKDRGVPILGAVACGNQKPTLHISVTPKNTDPLYMGRNFGKTFRVTIENRSNIDYFRSYPKVFFALPAPPRGDAYEWKGHAPNAPDGERIEYTGYGDRYAGDPQLPLVPTGLNGFDLRPITVPAYNPQKPGINRYEFDVHLTGNGINGESGHKCPSGRGRVFNGDGTPVNFDYENGRFLIGFSVAQNDPDANYVVDASAFEAICNNVDLAFNKPGGHVAPGEKFATVMTIANRYGYAHKLPFEMRFPIGSAVFPAEALGEDSSPGPDLFSTDLPDPLRGLLTCQGTNGAQCGEGNIAATVQRQKIGNNSYAYIVRGVINKLSEGQSLDLTLNMSMGVVPTVASGYKATGIIGAHGDMTPGSSAYYGGSGSSDHTQISWSISNDKVDFGWSNSVSYDEEPPSGSPEFRFTGSLHCPSSRYELKNFAMLVPAGKLNSPHVNERIQKYWYRDQCVFTATAPDAPNGYLWRSADEDGRTTYHTTGLVQNEKYTVSTKTVRNYTFNWTLAKAPQIITHEVRGDVIDPCGSDNAYYKEPEDKTGFTWTRQPDGSVDVVASNGYAFAGRTPHEFVTHKHFDPPTDSNRACPTIKVKGTGLRAEGSDHQFTLSWKQIDPASTASTVSATSEIEQSTRQIAFESHSVETKNGARGEVTLTTTPGDALDTYSADLVCSYPDSRGTRASASVMPAAPVTGHQKWTVSVPNTNQMVTCEATIMHAQGNVRVVSRDGGYEGTPPTSDVSTHVIGTQEWTIYPESSTPGMPDIAKGVTAVEESDSSTFVFNQLKTGVYYVERSHTPDGYAPGNLQSPDTQTVRITEGGQRRVFLKLSVTAGVTSEIRAFSQRQPGVLQFHKVSALDPTLFLEGSEWKLSSQDGGLLDSSALSGQGADLRDCVADTAIACTGLDRNPAPGKFTISSLKWGTYTLTETKAPLGYRLPAQASRSKEITVSASALQPRLIGDTAITNDQAGVPSIPHTGGLGRDHLIISGSVLLIIAVAATVWLMRQSQQLSPIRPSAKE